MARQQSQWLLLSSLLLLSLSALSSPPKIPYAAHCDSIVPLSPLRTGLVDPSISFQFNGHFSGGDGLFGPDPAQVRLPGPAPYVYFFFAEAEDLRQTRARGVIHLDGSLNIEGPITPHQGRKRASFALSGLWDESTGDLCMVGSNWAAINTEICPLGSGCGRRDDQGTSLLHSVVLKLNYPKESNISNSLVTGTLRSLDSVDGRSYFDPIPILSYAQMSYSYTRMPQVIDSCKAAVVPGESIGLEGADPCRYISSMLYGQFRLEHANVDASGTTTFGPSSDTAFASFNQVRCSEHEKVHMNIVLSNASGFGDKGISIPDKSLVGEGFWDQEKRTLCLVACPVIGMNGSIGDCSIGLSLWFPAVVSLRRRAAAFGRMWSNKERSDPGYFHAVSLRSLSTAIHALPPGWTYHYGDLDAVRRSSCSNDDVPSLGNKTYPNVDAMYDDMRFDIALRDVEGSSMWGFASPLAFGHTNADPDSFEVFPDSNQSSWNVSYRLLYTFVNSSSNMQQSREIAAEGVYNASTGKICMVGCQYPSTLLAADDTAADCRVLIDIQLPPTSPGDGEFLTGRIASTRDKSDRLYFEPLEVSSSKLYKKQAMESVWRMDTEMAMVLASLSLSCICIVSQLLHVKRHEEVIPSMSITMLAVLTVGYMIPLVLNFKALFMMNRNKRNVLLWRGGWMEMNEITVRAMTMVAFLLQLRLLERAWRIVRPKGLRSAERRVLQLCVPLYLAGAVVAWFVHWRSYESLTRRHDFNSHHPHSLWEDLVSYSGLMLDGFLLPQVILNMVANSKGRALTPLYYIGTTAVRAMPHAYDAYRSRHYFPRFGSSSYIYASQEGELYSSAWDVIVPLQGFLLALLVCLQQRFGGRCLLPQRRATSGGYEMVPVFTVV